MESELREKELRIIELTNEKAEDLAVHEKTMIEFRHKMNQTIDIINKNKVEKETVNQNELRSLQRVINYQEIIYEQLIKDKSELLV